MAILQGNATVARLMQEFLEEQAFEVELLQGPPPGAPRAHLVVVDIDSDVESAERWLRHCEGRQLPVLKCGVAASRQRGDRFPWLNRPFTADDFVRRCQEVVGQALDVGSGAEEIPPPIQIKIDSRESPTLEMPTASALEVLEDEEWQEPPQGSEEWQDILPLDGSSSMILEIEDLSGLFGQGGLLVGKGSRRSLEAEELAGAYVDSGLSEPIPADEEEQEFGAGFTDTPTSGDATVVSTWEDVVAGDFSSVHRIATLLAEHWDRLGLTARPADRADRLQRVLTAMWRGGLESLIDELKRIPAVHGFSGRLETLSIEALLATISDRGLRGCLEIGMGGDSFVLYLDGGILDEVDSLGENTDGILLRSLRSMGALDEEVYRYYRRRRREQSGESLEMALRADAAVEEGHLLAAKKARAHRLVERMREGRSGTFAFIEVPRDSGQSWPIQSLGVLVRDLLDGPETGPVYPGKAGEAGGLAEMAAQESWAEQDVVTEPERPAMGFQRGDGGAGRPVVGEEEEPIEEVLARVKRLELLRRLGHGDDDGGLRGHSWSGSELAGPDEETQQEVGFRVGIPQEFGEWPQSGTPSDNKDPAHPSGDHHSEE